MTNFPYDNSNTPLRPSVVSRALVAAGHTKSNYHTSKQVRGYGSSTEGFECEAEKEYRAKQNWFSGRVVVGHFEGSGKRHWSSEDHSDANAAKLDAYEATLTAKGYTVTRGEVGGTSKVPVLYVTKENS